MKSSRKSSLIWGVAVLASMLVGACSSRAPARSESSGPVAVSLPETPAGVDTTGTTVAPTAITGTTTTTTAGTTVVDPLATTTTSGTTIVDPLATTTTSGTTVVDPLATTTTSGTTVVDPLATTTTTSGTTVIDPLATTTTATTTVIDPLATTTTATTSVIDPLATTTTATTTVIDPLATATTTTTVTSGTTVIDPLATTTTTVVDPLATTTTIGTTVVDPLATTTTSGTTVVDPLATTTTTTTAGTTTTSGTTTVTSTSPAPVTGSSTTLVSSSGTASSTLTTTGSNTTLITGSASGTTLLTASPTLTTSTTLTTTVTTATAVTSGPGTTTASGTITGAGSASGANSVMLAQPLQNAYLKASNADSADLFAYSVAISGNTAVVGAIGEDSSLTTVRSGAPNNVATGNDGTDSGAAYIFVKDAAGIWSQQAYLKASNATMGDLFGSSVAISGNLVAVGSPQEDSALTTVIQGSISSPLAGNLAPDSGAVYVFARDPLTGSWSQQAYLKASNGETADRFGSSVAISGNTVLAAAPNESNSLTTIVAGAPSLAASNNLAANAGAVYVFTRDLAGNWSQQAYLKASNNESNDQFGSSLAISGDTAVVGASLEDSALTTITAGNISEITAGNLATDAGAAYVFVRNVTTGKWSQQACLKASNAEGNDQFGHSVAISLNTIVVGADQEDSALTTITAGNLSEATAGNLATDAGAAYVFVKNNKGNWSQEACLKPANAEAGDRFAYSVAVSGDVAVIGAVWEDSAVSGPSQGAITEFFSGNGAPAAGAAYVFVRRTSGDWLQNAYLKASNPASVDVFGNAIAIDGNSAIIGAMGEDSGSNAVVNGIVSESMAGNAAAEAGAAYIYSW